jgi:toxin ParE1/3/4
MVEIRWTDQAIEDVNDIAEFIAKDSEKYATIQVQRFFDSVTVLTEHPEAGKVVPELGYDEIRELLQGNYRIIYRLVSEAQIDILTVHHSRRLLSNNPTLGS